MRFPHLNRAGMSLLLGITSGLLWGGMYGWARQDFGGTHLLLWADANLYSQFFRWRGPQEPHPDVVILAIDETSQNLADLFTVEELAAHPILSQMTRSPWPRAVFAAVLEKLGSAGARMVAFDVIFDQASVYGPEDDQIFAEVIGRYAQQTLFAVSRSEEVRIWPGGARTVRVKLTPLWSDYAAQNPRLGLVNLPLSPNRQVLTLPGAMELDRERLPFAMVASGQEAMPQALGINYRGPQGTYPTFPLWYLFEPSFWQVNLANGAVFRDKIVLIGDTTQLGQDLWSTPLDPLMPGVEIHANAVGTLLAGNGIRTVPWGWGSLLILTSGVGIGLGLAFCRGVLPKLGLTLAWGGLCLAGGYGAFLQEWSLPVAGLLAAGALAGLADTTLQGVEERRNRLRLGRILQRRVAPAVLAELLRQPESFSETLGGQLRPVAILFSDIRDFTPLAANMAATDLVALLNRYFAAMVEPILAEQGTIDKFIGDAIMAEFGAPLFRDATTEALAAVRAAVGMRLALERLRSELQQEGQPLLQHGIGIHFGEVVVGNLGSPQRLEYTVIGDAVNVAARIESLTKSLGRDILISDAVYRLVQAQVQVEDLGFHVLKGKTEPIRLYAVQGLLPPPDAPENGVG